MCVKVFYSGLVQITKKGVIVPFFPSFIYTHEYLTLTCIIMTIIFPTYIQCGDGSVVI